MSHHIVCVMGTTDRYSPSVSNGDSVLLVPFDIPGHPDALQTSLPDDLGKYGLTPTNAAWDFMRAAICAYTGDVRISRRHAYDGWTRDLVLHLAVDEPDRWAHATPILQRALAFLTGDRWQVFIRPARREYRRRLEPRQTQLVPIETNTVSLFSGGLDSYVGALDVLSSREQVLLIGHHAAGQGPTSTAQNQVMTTLRQFFPPEAIPFLRCWLSPPKGANRSSETTTRGRSILFLALGVLAASSLKNSRLLIPENGFISLNVPLTPPRSGSFSTRTTHPHLIALIDELLRQLGIAVTLELPYQFSTKREMLINCSNEGALKQGLSTTMSCAHPGAGRFVKGGNPNQHCGYCVPCLIRRSSIAHWRMLDPTTYRWNDLGSPLSPSRGADLRAVKLALDRYGRRPPTLADVLTAGPLPGTPEELTGYFNVFRRGLAELQRFIDSSS